MTRLIHKTRSIGLTEFVDRGNSGMDRLLERLRDPTLFYPDPEVARSKAESQRRYYTVSTRLNPGQVDRHIEWLYHEFCMPREVNLNPCRLSLAVSLAVQSM